MAARIGLNVWGICDAVHVSKVKNILPSQFLHLSIKA